MAAGLGQPTTSAGAGRPPNCPLGAEFAEFSVTGVPKLVHIVRHLQYDAHLIEDSGGSTDGVCFRGRAAFCHAECAHRDDEIKGGLLQATAQRRTQRFLKSLGAVKYLDRELIRI